MRGRGDYVFVEVLRRFGKFSDPGKGGGGESKSSLKSWVARLKDIPGFFKFRVRQGGVCGFAADGVVALWGIQGVECRIQSVDAKDRRFRRRGRGRGSRRMYVDMVIIPRHFKLKVGCTTKMCISSRSLLWKTSKYMRCHNLTFYFLCLGKDSGSLVVQDRPARSRLSSASS
jgi:hypothetical protein